MAGPYVYGAPATYPYPYQQTPYTGYHNTPQHSPFIPPAELNNYPPSPYRSNSPLPDLAPNTVQFPGTGSYDPAGYPNQYPYRPRAPSYHGPQSPYVAPVVAPALQATPWQRPQRLSNPLYPGVVPGVQSYPASPWTGVGTPLPLYTDLPITFDIHSFLNGEIPRPDFMFNLPSLYFSPMQVVHGQFVPLSPEILAQPATNPPIHRLRVVCDEIPEWPMTLEYDPESYREQTGMALSYPPPISLGDVLSMIHRMLHQQITHVDWARLDTRKQVKITQAYTARCKSAPTMESLLKSHGVKRVDYLLDKVWFKGLIRTRNGPEELKLVISRRQ
ncbi:hypothetical protein AX14_006270 [Amanita brunnescens Koide BX004]|nr:hypothetical protein AX14_006270 [Amanita brunnescens Koide BX004]